MSAWLFLEPLDVLYVRGNSSFGGAGEHAEALMPPWPSVFSGALRSALLARSGVNLGTFTDEKADFLPPPLHEVLGTPSEPGTFQLTAVALARRLAAREKEEGSQGLELFFPLPADLMVLSRSSSRECDEGHARGKCKEEHAREEEEKEKMTAVHRLRPTWLEGPAKALAHGGPTLALPVWVTPTEGKASSGWWLTGAGLAAYLAGEPLEAKHFVRQRDLWCTDFRLGIARSRQSFTAAEGMIYTTEAVALRPGVGFAVEVAHCPAELLKSIDLVRLGGDGRGARVGPLGEVSMPKVAPAKDRVLFYLVTPGLFPRGWLLPGAEKENGHWRISGEGFKARLVCAAVPRAQVVSGWDLAAHRPKPAQRVVPAGSVYYLDEVEGDPRAYLEGFESLIADELTQRGGGDRFDTLWRQRKAEGFNNFLLGRWPEA